jgi:predicted RNA-binding protein associated with RNAse of E/G family
LQHVGGDMSGNMRWEPGAQIVLREVWKGNIWSVRPEILVQDTPNMLALYRPAGTPWKRPVSRDGTPLRLTSEDWVLADFRMPIESLRLVTPGASHSVLLLWSEGFDSFLTWYINLEEPLRRTAIGFDYMDQVLDIEISEGLKSWHWKDEDELEEAQALGLISEERARELRAEGERVIEQMEAKKPPFDADWETWRPDPSWPAPELPEDWDTG